jgi:hypothetical protein
MKQLLIAAALTLAATAAQAQYFGTGSNSRSHSVLGHTTSSGTYVAPHVATNPNSTQRDNYSATGNVNPYTGAVPSARGIRDTENGPAAMMSALVIVGVSRAGTPIVFCSIGSDNIGRSIAGHHPAAMLPDMRS